MSNEHSEDLKLQEYHNSRVVYFDSWVKAWINNRMEFDKQLLTLSALAIGLLVGVLNEPDTAIEFLIWLFTGISFALCALSILFIYQHNCKYIEILIQEHQAENVDKAPFLEKEQDKTRFLNRCTTIAFVLFLTGVALTIALTVSQSGFNIMKGN